MSLPYFPFYPTDFEAKTSHLSMLEDGAYNRLLRLCWMTPGCSLPDDEAWIMRRVRAFTDEERAAVVTVLAEFFEVEDGRLFSPRLRKEAMLSAERHARRVDAGKKGGRPPASLKSNDIPKSNALAEPKQPEPEPEEEREEANASLSPDGDALAAHPLDEVAEAVAAYNLAAQASGWPEVRILSKARRSALAARLRECGGLAGWAAALSRAQASPHCCGQNDRGWVANFDFLTRQSSFAKLMEGNYDNRNRGIPGGSGSGRSGSGTVDAFAAVAHRRAARPASH